MADHAEDLALLLDAARKAGAIAMRYFRQNPEVWMKSGQSPVSEADYAVDTFLRETLTAARPCYGWLSEETADSAARLSARRTFVVDPIDGTRGFLDGSDSWCVSLAVVEDGRSIAGVLDCPARGEVFEATPGQGARKNGIAIGVRRPGVELDMGGPKPFFDALPEEWRERIRRVPHIPSLAYRLALIAEGRLDATFVKPNAHDWDIAAADLILREAGGLIVDANGTPPSYGGAVTAHGALVAGSGDLLAAITGVIAAAER
ncbi:3'(2'),5'-bisphosphate nucleotidase CysQ [Pseudaminobacter soli (ex Li et al. 2025)]|uniref:3'(2'),5'-bisphosphate nucleotidase CysQ n=1 Tax=Pseudaminobacter soli (ex Li et al. 2025) TaxID=1295366 RepID=A0A2P7S7Q6_9HYPH|nr:3'(2'),5'-bisphosphate nucleotidase CysQ [Mesorhizobium soli]PSJ58504.1 3'(2'),5'-bisphosphate nucleotidase CysQ [Mesorhizobium soli]